MPRANDFLMNSVSPPPTVTQRPLKSFVFGYITRRRKLRGPEKIPPSCGASTEAATVSLRTCLFQAIALGDAFAAVVAASCRGVRCRRGLPHREPPGRQRLLARAGEISFPSRGSFRAAARSLEHRILEIRLREVCCFLPRTVHGVTAGGVILLQTSSRRITLSRWARDLFTLFAPSHASPQITPTNWC